MHRGQGVEELQERLQLAEIRDRVVVGPRTSLAEDGACFGKGAFDLDLR